jgi:hypothetical protein
VRAVNEVARAVVEKHNRARYIDAYELFSGKDGDYTPTLPGEDGEAIRVRAGDGIHLTPEGGALLANRVYTPLDKRCDLDGQAVPDKAKQVIKTKGSGEAAGGSRQGSGAGTTTPPTAAPAVAPPGGSSAPATTPKTNGGPPQTTPTTPQTTPTTPQTTPQTTPTTPDTTSSTTPDPSSGSPSGSTP